MIEATGNGSLKVVNRLMDTSYSYDSLSRLSSETRAFNDTATGFNQSFTFNYQYNLAGQLTEFSDANETQRTITYERDKIGRVVSVKNNQTNPPNGVQDYATNIQYRAFGGMKSMVHGSIGTGKLLTQTYNNRLQLQQFDASGDGNTSSNIGSVNKYYADGSLKSTDDSYNDTFDRLYKYDYVGRISAAKSGLEARDETQTSDVRPYRQTYGYNSFGNLTSRTGQVWDTTPDPMTATYTNNRNNDPNWEYDADGRNLASYSATSGIGTFYDAAGRRIYVSSVADLEQIYDGDGKPLKQTALGPTKYNYYINSSVLGRIYEVTKAGSNWVKKNITVYLNGQPLTVQNNYGVLRIYENPATGAMRGSHNTIKSEPDPLGIDNGLTAPPIPYNSGGGEVPDFILPSHIVDPSNFTTGCRFGGLPINCDAAEEVNAAAQNFLGRPERSNLTDSPLPDYAPPGAFPSGNPTMALAYGSSSTKSAFGKATDGDIEEDPVPIIVNIRERKKIPDSLSPITTTLSNRIQTRNDGININKRAKKVYEQFKQANKDCATLAQSLGLDETQSQGNFIEADEKLLKKKLSALKFAAKDFFVDKKTFKNSTLGDFAQGALALTNRDTNTVYILGYESGFDAANVDLRFGDTVFHESLHLKFGSHQNVADKLGLSYNKTAKTDAEREESADEAVNNFVGDGCIKAD